MPLYISSLTSCPGAAWTSYTAPRDMHSRRVFQGLIGTPTASSRVRARVLPYLHWLFTIVPLARLEACTLSIASSCPEGWSTVLRRAAL